LATLTGAIGGYDEKGVFKDRSQYRRWIGSGEWTDNCRLRSAIRTESAKDQPDPGANEAAAEAFRWAAHRFDGRFSSLSVYISRIDQTGNSPSERA
jgi:hypothetical protein